jgi:hypothetical protein
MTPGDRLFSVKASDRLDYRLVASIYRAGYSRIPVWDDARTQIVGLLFAKDLMLIEPRTRTPVITVVHFFGRQHVNSVEDEDTLDEVLRVFGATRQHFAIVRSVDASGPGDPVYRVAGVITLEDVTEEIIGEEVLDEFDVFRPQQPACPSGAAGASASGATAGGHRRGDGSARAGDATLVDIATGGAPGSGFGTHADADVSAGAAGSASHAAEHAYFLDTGFGMRPSEREARTNAAIRRLYAVTQAGDGSSGGDDACAHGVNNDMSYSETQGLAAHLLTNVPAFVPESAGGSGGHFDFDSVRRLVQRCAIVDVIAAPRKPAPGLALAARWARAAAAGGRGGDGLRLVLGVGAQVDPTTFGQDYIPAILNGTVAAAAAADRVSGCGGAGGVSGAGVGLSNTPSAALPKRGAGATPTPPVPAAATAPWGAAAACTLPQSAGSAPLPAAPASDPCALFTRGQLATACFVVLEGEMEVRSGADCIRCTVGPWDVLAEGALTQPEGSYRADFTATPLSPVVRAVRISKMAYDSARLATLACAVSGDHSSGDSAEGAAGGGEPAAVPLHLRSHPRGLSGAEDAGFPSPSAFASTAFHMQDVARRASAAMAASGAVGSGWGQFGRASGHPAPPPPPPRQPQQLLPRHRGAPSSGSDEPMVERWLAERSTTALPPSPFSKTADELFPPVPVKYEQHKQHTARLQALRTARAESSAAAEAGLPGGPPTGALPGAGGPLPGSRSDGASDSDPGQRSGVEVAFSQQGGGEGRGFEDTMRLAGAE